jgi:hypothetical protein
LAELGLDFGQEGALGGQILLEAESGVSCFSQRLLGASSSRRERLPAGVALTSFGFALQRHQRGRRVFAGLGEGSRVDALGLRRLELGLEALEDELARVGVAGASQLGLEPTALGVLLRRVELDLTSPEDPIGRVGQPGELGDALLGSREIGSAGRQLTLGLAHCVSRRVARHRRAIGGGAMARTLGTRGSPLLTGLLQVRHL